MVETGNKIKVYGTSWCGDSRRAKMFFETNHIDFEWIDIDTDHAAGKFVESVNNGYRSVPTILFPDGTLLVEPSIIELQRKLNI